MNRIPLIALILSVVFGPQLWASESTRQILTPKPPAAAKVNGPTIYGARPGHEFLYRIPCTGERPVRFAAEGLPATLHLDPATGIITGLTPDKPGTYAVTLQASNSKGKSSRLFRIVVGDTLALTPPMGWNTWYSYYEQVTDKVMQKGVVAWIESRPSFPMTQMDYAAMLRRRTESGPPASSIWLRTATPTAASAC